MRDYPLVGCGHCGVGILARAAPTCPFQPHPLCDACFATETTFVATTQRRRRRGKNQASALAPQRPGGTSWPVALRAVRSWLAPWWLLQRMWHNWTTAPPPTELRYLLEALARGEPLYLYVRP